MRKFFIIILTVSFVLLFLPACSNSAEHLSLPICGSYAVPGMFCSDLKGNQSTYEVVETDSHGRVLFIYTAKHAITQQIESAYVICQKYDSEYVYYYEDICYLLGQPAEEEILLLKEQNDWEQPLDLSKSSRRPNKSTVDLYITTGFDLDYQTARRSCRNRLSLPSDHDIQLTFIDVDPSGQHLMLLQFERENSTEFYIVLINQQYAIDLLPIAGDALYPIDPKVLSEFKAENGWLKE